MYRDSIPAGNVSENFCAPPSCSSESSWLSGWESVFPDLRNRKPRATPGTHGIPLDGLGLKGVSRPQCYHRNMEALSTDDRGGEGWAVEEDDSVTAEGLWGSAIIGSNT